MRAFLEQYGIAIFVIIIIGIMVLMASGIGTNIEILLTKKIQQFETTGSKEVTDAMTKKEDGNNGGSEELDLSTINTDLATNTWEEVQKIVQAGKATEAGWSVGDTKKVEVNGYEYTATLIGLNHPDDGENTATFMIKSSIGVHVMNSTNTNEGGWEASELRSWLNNDIYNNMSNKDQIKTVKKKTNNKGVDGREADITETEDKVFVLSATEVNQLDTSLTVANEGTVYEYFKTNTFKAPSKPAWSRSSSIQYNSCFCYTISMGIMSVGGAIAEVHVCPVFVIG